MARAVREGVIREGIREGIGAVKDATKDVAKSTSNAAVKQFSENLFGWGPKDEGNYNEAVNAMFSELDEEAKKTKKKILEEWLLDLEEFERNWFRRVIANMVADAVALIKSNGKNQQVDISEIAKSAAQVLEELVENYHGHEARTNAARVRGLLKQHTVRKSIQKVGEVIQDLVENTRAEYAEAGQMAKKRWGRSDEEKKRKKEELQKKLAEAKKKYRKEQENARTKK